MRIVNTGLPPKMEDVARAAGVSKAAVSHVLNNRAGEVSTETRTRILTAVRELGYRPAATRKLQARSQFKTLGFVVTANAADLVEPSYFSRIFRAILTEAERREVHVTVFTRHLFDVNTDDMVRFYCDGRCDGLILCALRHDSPLPSVLSFRGTPYVLVGSSTRQEEAVSVDVDHKHGVDALVDHLVGLGHTRITFMPGPEYTSAAPLRREAFLSSIASRGLPEFNVPILDTDLTSRDFENWVLRQFATASERRPTAVVCWNDTVAFELINQMQRMGHRIPDDLSIVGFDDSPEADRFMPGLTSYRQPYERLAQQAIKAAMSLFERTPLDNQITFIPGALTVRGSTSNHSIL